MIKAMSRSITNTLHSTKHSPLPFWVFLNERKHRLPDSKRQAESAVPRRVAIRILFQSVGETITSRQAILDAVANPVVQGGVVHENAGETSVLHLVLVGSFRENAVQCGLAEE